MGVLEGILYAVGGHDGPLVRKSVEAFDPSKMRWAPVGDMTFCRRNAGIVAMNGLLYVVGGDDGSCNLASVEVITISQAFKYSMMKFQCRNILNLLKNYKINMDYKNSILFLFFVRHRYIIQKRTPGPCCLVP